MRASNPRRVGTPLAFALAALLLAALACGPLDDGGVDTIATVNAVSTSVRQTLEAGTPLPGQTLALPLPTVNLQTFTPPPATPTSNVVTPSPSPTPLISATTAPLARPNGAVVSALRRVNTISVDGAFTDWAGLPNLIDQAVFRPENWTGIGDQSALYAAAWDEVYLYLAVQATDDAYVQTERGELIFRGDSVELLFDANFGGDFSQADLSADDYQIGLSPGASGGAAEAYVWFPAGRAGAPGGLLLAAQTTALGYNVEAAIPWSLLGVAPLAGQRFGFALSLSDNDTAGGAEQQSMVSSVSTRRLANPTTWGTMALDE